MTVPPTPPPRPNDESPQQHDPHTNERTTPETGLPPETTSHPTRAGAESASADAPASAPTSGQTSPAPAPTEQSSPAPSLPEPSQPAPSLPEQPPPAPSAPASGPAYLSGILTAGLAAVCGAIFTSWTGVQGTLIGAMVGATIGSTVSELVRAPLDALERRIIAAGVSPWRVRRDGVVKTVMTSPAAAQQAFGMVSRGAVLTVGATAIVGFLLAIGGVTAVESASGQPLAATLGGESEETTGTTIGNVLPNPPAALAPVPTDQTTTARNDDQPVVAGRSGGGMTAYPPTVLPRPGQPLAAVPDASPTPETEALPGASPSPEADQDNVAAAPGASPSPEAALAETSSPTPVPGSPVPDDSPVVQVVTVVVTATPSPSPMPADSSAAIDQAMDQPPTATATFTPTPTVTPTPTSTPGSTDADGSPPTPAPPPET